MCSNRLPIDPPLTAFFPFALLIDTSTRQMLTLKLKTAPRLGANVKLFGKTARLNEAGEWKVSAFP